MSDDELDLLENENKVIGGMQLDEKSRLKRANDISRLIAMARELKSARAAFKLIKSGKYNLRVRMGGESDDKVKLASCVAIADNWLREHPEDKE